MTIDDIKRILENHRKWLTGEAGGERANLRGADLSGAYLPSAPIIPDLHQRMAEATDPKGALIMDSWHTCETTHCRAGWAIHLAGNEGYALEEKVGPCVAGALIYHASTGMVPDFFTSNADALADIKACAGKAAAPTPN